MNCTFTAPRKQTFTISKLVLSSLAITALHTSIANAADANPLLGFRCASAETKTVATVTIQNNRISGITVHPEANGEIHYARTAALQEIGQNRYAGTFQPPTDTDADADTKAAAALPQTLNYEMTFSLENTGIPEQTLKVHEASLKENGIAPTNLDCTPVFQNRTHQAHIM